MAYEHASSGYIMPEEV